jgi:tetratricopeptide (TPR) repeat protein
MKKLLVVVTILGSLWLLTANCQVQYLPDTIKLNLRILTNPDDRIAYYNRATVRKECSDYKGAIADFTQVIRIDPLDAGAYHHQGQLRQRLGDEQGALEDYQEAVKIYTQTRQTQNREMVPGDIKRMPLLQKGNR